LTSIINSLRKAYLKKKAEIKRRLKDFGKNSQHFYELCFCIITPQSNAFRCDECVQVLKDGDFARREMEIEGILKKYTRFHKTKSKRLILLKNQTDIIENIQGMTGEQARSYLVRNVKGIGWKEASHFLRNIGYRNLAILDRHILKNLKKYNVISSIPFPLTEKRYFEIEKKFRAFSEKIQIPMDELDLLFWSMQTGKVFK